MTPILTFIRRVREMQNSRSKEMRLTYQEAFDLSVSLNELLINQIEKQPKDDGKVIIRGGKLKQ